MPIRASNIAYNELLHVVIVGNVEYLKSKSTQMTDRKRERRQRETRTTERERKKEEDRGRERCRKKERKRKRKIRKTDR